MEQDNNNNNKPEETKNEQEAAPETSTGGKDNATDTNNPVKETETAQNTEAAAKEDSTSAGQASEEIGQNIEKASNKNSMRVKQIALSVLALLFVGGAVFSIVYPQKALSLLEPFGVSTSKPAAEVNGEKIYQKDLEARLLQQKSAYEAQGADFNDPAVRTKAEKQVLEAMVTETLVLQSAKKEEVSVEQSAIDERYNQAASSFSSPEEFQAELANYSLTEETLRDNIENQLLIEKYLEGAVDQEATTVSEEEITSFYDEYSASIEDAESLEVLRPDIVEYLQQQKTDKEIQKVVKELRDNAEIEILL